MEIETIEVHREIPIVVVGFKAPAAISASLDRRIGLALLDLPHPAFVALVNHRNLSFADGYGPAEQAAALLASPFRDLAGRLIALVPFRPGSFTSLIQRMQAHLLARGAPYASFAPDLESAIRSARHAIDNQKRSLAPASA